MRGRAIMIDSVCYLQEPDGSTYDFGHM